MTEKQMIKANSLYKRRESLLKQKEIWEGATGFSEIDVVSKGCTRIIAHSFLDFFVVKTLALGNIEKELKEVQAEFDEL